MGRTGIRHGAGPVVSSCSTPAVPAFGYTQTRSGSFTRVEWVFQVRHDSP
jgi:hypothetical protein